MKTARTSLNSLVFIRLNPGDDLLEGIKKAVEKEGIKNAVILQGVGSVVSHSCHVVGSTKIPVRQDFFKGLGPADIVNVNGFVIDGRVHAHVIFADTRVSFGGHLESGVEVLSFGIITLGLVEGDFSFWDKAGNIEDHINNEVNK